MIQKEKPEERGVAEAEEGEKIWERGINCISCCQQSNTLLDLAARRVQVTLTKTI